MKAKQPIDCAYCGKATTDLHRDHVVPRSRGGPDSATNIVMACQECNSAKNDRLPSEWMGDRCPPRILMIEIQVHNRLKKDFGYRDKGPSKKGRFQPKAEPTLFAFNLTDGGRVEYVGEVVTESDTTVRLNVVNCFHLWAGIWDPTGELKDFQKSRCRIFTSRDECAAAVERLSLMAERRKAREAVS